MAMTKKEIIELCYDTMCIPKTDCRKIVDSLFDIIKEELIQSNDVMISGFGRWSVKKKSARNGRNPQTCEPMTIGARKVVTFKGSATLRNKINSRH